MDEMATLYPLSSQHPLSLEEAEKAVMMVAWRQGEAIACGVLRPLEPDIGEIKRMFVAENHRRQGVARMVLHELEAIANKLGYKKLRLETGKLQPGAIALYEMSGYRKIPPFGDYIDDPWSLCFEKPLKPDAPTKRPGN